MVIIDIRYMWSAILSPRPMPNRLQPSRFSVLSRSMRWKNGTGEPEPSLGVSGRASSTALTDHGDGFGREEVCDMFLAARTGEGVWPEECATIYKSGKSLQRRMKERWVVKWNRGEE